MHGAGSSNRFGGKGTAFDLSIGSRAAAPPPLPAGQF